MINSTYTADISGALKHHPAISGSIVSGLAGQMDPTTEAYAASYELRRRMPFVGGKEYMITQRFLRTQERFTNLVLALDQQSRLLKYFDNIAQLTGLSAASLAANGLNASSTVGEWRSTIVNKLGSSTAYQAVLVQRRRRLCG